MARDYDEPPKPSILLFDPSHNDMNDILQRLQAADSTPRIVLHAMSSSHIPIDSVQLGENNKRWGNDRTPPDQRGLPSATHFSRRLERISDDSKESESLSLPSIDMDAIDFDSLTDMSWITVATESARASGIMKSSTSSSRRLQASGDFALQASIDRVTKWAEDSVGLFARSFDRELRDYGIIPSVKAVRDSSEAFTPITSMVINEMRTCEGLFSPLKGNRTCFQICD